MMKRIIIFGATGNLGSRLSVFLKGNGYDVIGVGHRKNDNGFFADHDIPYYSVDIANESDFKSLPTENIYAVLHFAGMLPAAMEGFSPAPYVSSIVQGTLNVLEYCRKVNADRIVFPQTLFDIYHQFGSKTPIKPDASRDVPYETDHSIYVIAKNAACELIEHYYNNHGIKPFVFRLSRVYMYSPNPYTYRNGKKIMISDRYLIYRAMLGLPIEIWGDPNRVLETISIYDFQNIILCALKADHDGGFYNIGSGGSTLDERIHDIVEVFSPLNSKSEIIYCPEKRNTTQFLLDIEKTKKELGYQPQYTWKDYLLKFKEEMETQPFSKLMGVESDYFDFEKFKANNS